jgi:hypothetical protein
MADRITSFTDKENVAAQSVLQKSEFQCVGSIDSFYFAPQLLNERRDVFSYVYGIE